MNVAHLAVITPNRCGLYETTRELVVGLRKQGLNSCLVDPQPEKNPVKFSGTEDRGALVADLEWAQKADILVSHSGIPKELEGRPYVLVAHGRPRSSFLIESKGGGAVYSHYYRTNEDKHCKSVVSFWPEHEPYLRVLMPDKPIRCVQSSVDLDFWTPGPRRYDFHGHKGQVNVVISDAWRDDVDPYYPLNVFALFARERKDVKLHIYGRPKGAQRGWDALLQRIRQDGNLGEVMGWTSGLREVYRSADLVLTANTIDVRTRREAMACGCPVVTVGEDIESYRPDIIAALNEDREFVRLQAMKRYNPENTAKQFAEVLS